MAERFIDGTGMVAGRLATFVAKQALLGDKIVIVNAEKAIVTGRKKNFLDKFKHKRELGTPFSGPFFPRTADRMLRRIIRGMLPHKQPKGKAAYQNVMCYLGVPEEMKDKKLESLEIAQLSKEKSIPYQTLEEYSKLIK